MWQYNLKKYIIRNLWSKVESKGTGAGKSNTDKTEHSKITKENSANKSVKNEEGQTKKWIKEKQ